MTSLSVPTALATSVLAFLSMLLLLQPASAQVSEEKLDAILADIDQKTDRYSKFRSLLSDPDQAKRMAAFSGMMNSGIPTLQNMALDNALNSGDAAMQAAALQAILTRTKALTFDIDFSETYSEETKKKLGQLGGFSIDIDGWDVATASFEGGNNFGINQDGRGQVSGLSLQYSSRACRTSISLDDSMKKMVGRLSCQYLEPVKVSLTIR